MDSCSYETEKAIYKYMLVREVKINPQQVSQNKRFINKCEKKVDLGLPLQAEESISGQQGKK